jgi:hypothetical protein
MAILAVSAIRKRMVANGRLPTGQRGYANPMVRKGWTDKPDQQVFVVKPLKETAGYVARTPGGVRGGGRETSLYSINEIYWFLNVLQTYEAS